MRYEEFAEFVRRAFPELDDSRMSQYAAMEGLYKDWNSKINVISRKDVDGFWQHHVLHSLAIAAYLKSCRPEVYASFVDGGNVLDLGTGGGFPGIPLAVMFPKSRFTLCDSIGKKITVVKAVSEALGLQNVEAVNARAETLPGGYDWVVSRAVTSLDTFYPWVKGKFEKGILYLKGGDIVPEMTTMMGRFHVPGNKISTWKITSWLQDKWFDGKMVVEIDA